MLIVTLILSTKAKSDPFSNYDPLIQVKDLYITGKVFKTGAQWPLISDLNPTSQLRYGLDLTLNTTFLGVFYWNNLVTTMTDETQFRSLAYKFEVGARILPCLYIEYGHDSWHTFDTTYRGGYQIYDYIGVRLNLINSSKDRTLFWYFDKGSE